MKAKKKKEIVLLWVPINICIKAQIYVFNGDTPQI